MSSNDSIEEDSIEIVDISEFFNADLTGSNSHVDSQTSDQKNTIEKIDSPIKELKAIILSLDWEITNETADNFVAEVDRLTSIWDTDKTVVSFLQILRALGKYLRTHKADAHPDSVHLLYSVYNNFEKIVLTNEITPDQEQAILNEELEKFHKLKKKIASAATAASEGKANDSLLSALKGVLLEIDWQITDQTMRKFDLEINRLEQVWRTDKIFLTPLQMMRAIGGYINKNKQDSHPDSIKLLNNVFQSFEKISLTDDMTDEEKQDIIDKDLESFSLLKKQISTAKPITPSPSVVDVSQIFADETASLPQKPQLPGQFSEDEPDGSGDIDISSVVPIGSDPDDVISPAIHSSPENEVTAEEIDNRLDDLFSFGEEETTVTPLPGVLEMADSESPIIPLPTEIEQPEMAPEITPLPETSLEVNDNVLDITSEPEQIRKTAHLQNIIDTLDWANPSPNLSKFTSEIDNLQGTFPNQSPQDIILQLIASTSTFSNSLAKENPDNHANQECISLLNLLAKALCGSELTEGGQPPELALAVKKYINFQDAVILPSIAKMQAREMKIKHILGLTA